MRTASGRQGGFTLVELLVVVTIIGVLVALMMPAIQSARESARQAQCSNNLKQLGAGASAHVEAVGSFPSGGWGNLWVGDPTRGFGRRQPGGWIYNLLPFIEYQGLYDDGSLQNVKSNYSTVSTLNYTQTQTPMGLFICPTRRRVALYPFQSRAYCNMTVPSGSATCSKTDYAINAGNATLNSNVPSFPNELDTSPSPGKITTLALGDACTLWMVSATQGLDYGWNGICYLHSEVTPGDVIDGLSNTILIGEKEMDSNHYRDGSTAGDKYCIVAGINQDTFRMATCISPASQTQPIQLQQDRSGIASQTQFGGPHPGLCIFVFCDGSVHKINLSVNAATFQYLAQRNDGQKVSGSGF
ncbi:MAG: DUF1559 domain-containing protein [Thermoguttaceae bacterium]|jgi:prepilin-type N-terminal cleavage/methylation domain-containing protein/prepilin-type processing-associated H-X9-DG protein